MRVLRLTMIGVSTLLVLLSGVVWYQGLTVVDYTVGQSIGLHFQGHRMYYLQVRGCLVAAFWCMSLWRVFACVAHVLPMWVVRPFVRRCLRDVHTPLVCV